jgi:hypothetical protein
MVDTVSFTVSDGEESEEFEAPAAIIDALREDGDESAAAVAGDIAMMGLTSRAHMIAHHGDGEAPEEIQEAESAALDLFEERFGMTYEEATGHSH